MENHVDRYAKGSTLVHFDPRVKLVCIFALVVLISTLTEISALALSLVFVIALVTVSRVPTGHVVKGYAMALPFILFASLTMLLTSGPESAMAMWMRVSGSVILLMLLVFTTPFMDLLWTLRWFKVPSLLSDMIMFTYRFIFVMLDESERMRQARKARGFHGGRSLLDRDAFKVISNTIGMIFLRSYRRANRVYVALLARGYDGQVRSVTTFRVHGKDAVLALGFVIIGAWTLALQTGWYIWP